MMKARKCTVLLGLLAIPFLGLTQLDSIPWSVTVWGQHRSNTLDHEMGRKLVRGGFIDQPMIQAAGETQGGDMGSFGYATGLDLRWKLNRMWRESGARVCGSVQVKSVGDIRWTPELFDLAFTGNAGHLGRWDVLDGSRFRYATWVHAAIGLEGKYQNRLEAGLVLQPAGINARIHNGYFYVDSEVDSLLGYVRAEAAFNQKPAWGIAVNAEWHFLREDAPFAFHLRLQNVGVTFVPSQDQFAVDTMFQTSGLTFAGESWSIEALENGDFGQDLLVSNPAQSAWSLLPGRLDASFEYPIGPRSGWDVQAQVGEWMPLPRAMTGYRRAIGKRWQAGIQLITGGWGRTRPAAWARYRVPGEHAWMLYIEDPFGWGTDGAYGRGVTLRYQNL